MQAISTTRICVAKLQYCHDDTCSHSSDLHLNVELVDVDLEKSRAIAISYTWGEFDRRDVVIGHDTQGKALTMNLGAEWDVQETLARLVLLCLENGQERGTDHAACWIDQLCIPQKDEEIRALLANIPSIYRTLDVVALMPSALCSCLRKRVIEMISGPDDPLRVPSVDLSRLTKSARECYNSVGLCSYFDRVWTRQEVLYSRRIRLVRTSDEEIPCVRSEAEASNLSRYSSLLFARSVLKYGETKAAFEAVRSAITVSTTQAFLTFKFVILSPRTFVKFLSGQQIELHDVGDRLRRFLRQLQDLCRSHRKATKARDYVTSVWVDCPGYILPMEFKKMCLPGLLEDAVRQLEVNYGVSLAVSSFPRLFGDCADGPVLWRPTKCIGRRRVTNGICEVYATLIPGHRLIPVTVNGGLPLRILAPARLALGELGGDYKGVFRDHDANQVLKALVPVIRNFALNVSTCLWIREAMWAGRPSNSIGRIKGATPLFLGSLYAIANIAIGESVTAGGGEGWTDTVDDLRFPPQTDHHEVVYQMVTAALGLSTRDCKACGLKLMVFLGECPCIGLTNMELGDGKDLYKRDTRTMVTICTDRPTKDSTQTEQENGNLLLEAIKEEGSPTPRYHVTGIWVPHRRISLSQVGAFVEAGAQDGIVV